jgi:hypothetical protein
MMLQEEEEEDDTCGEAQPQVPYRKAWITKPR